jgi:hypothetical protein
MPQHRTSTSFKKGQRPVGRRAGTPNKMTAEVKEVLARCFEDVGGYDAFVKWVESSPERLDTFYSKMWIKLLPMNIRPEGHKDVVYKSYEEVSIALADHGISLDSIQKLKQLDLKAERKEAEDPRHRLDKALEEGLEETFPASDAVAVVEPASQPPDDEA